MHDTLAPIWGCLLLLGDKLLIGNEDGVLHAFHAGREKKLVRKIEMSSPLYSGPAAFGGVLYVATAAKVCAIGR